jgi:hypothetical protein
MNSECHNFVKHLLEFFHRRGGDHNTVWDLKKRFLFMLDFCCYHNLETSQNILAYQWLLAGFLPGQGPDKYAEKALEVPPEATLIHGNKECVGKRETRYWSFAMPGKICYLAYNRSYALNLPAAVWILRKEF